MLGTSSEVVHGAHSLFHFIYLFFIKCTGVMSVNAIVQVSGVGFSTPNVHVAP